VEDPALTEYVVRELGRNVSKNDLIYNLCQRTGQPWDPVSKFIDEVERKHQGKIALRNSPLYIIIGIGIFLGGVWALCGGALYFVNFVQDGSISLNPLDLRRDYLTIIRLGTGLAMITGSTIGMIQLILSIIGKPAPRI
jgi:hypothetical protein